MTHRPVLFEDHTLNRFRPLAWSTPQFELRCGMFCLRERAFLAGFRGGSLALRGLLRPLATDPAWALLEPGNTDGPRLWLAGRLAPDTGLIAALAAAAAEGPFALADEAGLLAAAVTGEEAGLLAREWSAWEEEATAAGAWRAAGAACPTWRPSLLERWRGEADEQGLVWGHPADGGPARPAAVARALGWIWDIVPRTAAAIVSDLAAAADRPLARRPWGACPDPDAEPAAWSTASTLRRAAAAETADLVLTGPADLHLADGVTLTPGVAIDTSGGPVILDAGVVVGPHVLLEGPLYVGPGSRIKAGAAIYGESSFGAMNRLAGEIGESTFGDFANKQHDGFIGHAVLGSWINLGAMTTCSDLKNNYGPVRVDLGEGTVDTGLRFVGLLMGDHAKTAIGTLLNTGTCVGFAANVFGGGMPPKHVRNFSWGGAADAPDYAVDKAVATAAIVMARRGCRLEPGHEALFAALAAS